MGAAIDAVRPGAEIVRENTAFVVVATILGAVVGVLSLLLSIVPIVGPFVSGIVLTPALLATVHGMAFAGLVAGEASPGAGLQSLKSNYVSLAAASFLRFALTVAVFLLIVVAAAVVGTFVLGVGIGAVSASDPGAMAAPVAMAGISGLLLGLVFGVLLVSFSLLVALGLQFLDVAVVVGGESATDALRASWTVFRKGPISVVGYTLIRSAVVAGAIAVPLAVYFAGWRLVSAQVGVALLTACALGLGPLAWSFYSSYHVAYYDARMGNRLEGG